MRVKGSAPDQHKFPSLPPLHPKQMAAQNKDNSYHNNSNKTINVCWFEAKTALSLFQFAYMNKVIFLCLETIAYNL